MRRAFPWIAVCGIFLFCTGCLTPKGESHATSPAEAAAPDAPAAAALDDDAELCANILQQLAQNCFKATAFESDGSTPARVLDAEGNDLGEVDQAWAAKYCECYAQTAMQEFGCEAIIAHEELDDGQYEATYANVVRACTDATMTDADGATQ